MAVLKASPTPSDEPFIVNSTSDFEFEQNFNGSELDLDFASRWFPFRLKPGKATIESARERSTTSCRASFNLCRSQRASTLSFEFESRSGV